MNSLKRMRRLAGIREARQIDDPDQERDEESYRRGAKIERLIALALQRIDLAIAEDGIFYDEDQGREAIVELDDSQIDLDRLAKLKTTGLANSYVIWATKDQGMTSLSVMFSVDPGLDNAVVPDHL